VELTVQPEGESETWLRLFNGNSVATVQRESASGELAERFGGIEFRFRLSFADHTIHYRQVSAILRLALPFFPGDSAATMGVSAGCRMGDGRSERNRN